MYYLHPKCPVKNCKWRNGPYGPFDVKGGYCHVCLPKIQNNHLQKIVCKLCGEVYYIRHKIRWDEETFIQKGYCDFCLERIKEEKYLLEQGNIDNTEIEIDLISRSINKILNRGEIESTSEENNNDNTDEEMED